MAMTDIENQEDIEEKKESWYAKLRASLKEKYEGQINDLQAQIEQLRSSNVATKRNLFERSLKQEGYEGDFNDFANKYLVFLDDDFAFGVANGHGGILGAAHHDALKQRLTADAGHFSHNLYPFCTQSRVLNKICAYILYTICCGCQTHYIWLNSRFRV